MEELKNYEKANNFIGALAVASSLFTWDNKADAIVTKDYSKESRVNEKSKRELLFPDYYYWKIIDSLEAQFTGAIDLLEDYKYGDPIYKEAKDRLMTRVLGEDQYLLKKKIDEYELYKSGIKVQIRTLICLLSINIIFTI